MNAFCSLFSQILKFIPSSDFEGLCSRPIATRDCRSLASCKLVDLMYQLLPNARDMRQYSVDTSLQCAAATPT